MKERRSYLCVGESTTAGYPTVSGYRSALARAIGPDGWEPVGPFVDAAGLRHAGFPGLPSGEVLRYAPQLAADFPAHMVLVSAGLNDLPDTDPRVVAVNVRRTCDEFAVRGADVRPMLLSDVGGMSAQVGAFNRAILDTCGRVYPVVPAGPAIGPHTPGASTFVDEGHPSQVGYDRMALSIARHAFDIAPDVAAARIASAPSAIVGAPSGAGLFQLANAALLQADPSVPTPARQIALAIGYLETGFGQSGSWAPDGVPSNNWGGLTYRDGMPGYIVHGDVGADGQPINGGVKFGKWPTLSDGYVAFYRTWAKPDTWAAAVKGDAFNVALAMYRRHYFLCGVFPRSLCPTATEWDHAYGYAKAIMGGASAAAKALGEPLAVRLEAPPRPLSPSASKADLGRSLAVLGVAAGLVWATLKIKAPKPALPR